MFKTRTVDIVTVATINIAATKNIADIVNIVKNTIFLKLTTF